MVSPNLFIFTVCVIFKEISGHGFLVDPPSRSSLWRTDPSAPVNYNDNELFCGGREVQWNTYGGKCGVCGDVYSAPHPQSNENTGTYGKGKIVHTYNVGDVIEVKSKLTTNHLGNMQYSLCVLSNPDAPESGEDCFKPVQLADGSSKYVVNAGEKDIVNKVQLPAGLKCDRCVLRWQYTTGNNWGKCEDGSYAQGCGPQETFRNCADVTIA